MAWLVVNLPVMYLAPEGWAKFYSFSQTRVVDFGSLLAVLAPALGRSRSATETGQHLAMVLMVLAAAGIAALALTAPRRPRFAQLAFLIVARSSSPTRSTRPSTCSG